MNARRALLLLAGLIQSSCLLDQSVAPYPRDDVAATREDEPIAIDVLRNDYGVDEIVQIATQPMHGTASLQNDGIVLYTPSRESAGDDVFSYVARNSAGAASARVTVHVMRDSVRFGEPEVLLSHPSAMRPYVADLDRDQRDDLVVRAGNGVLALTAEDVGFREIGAFDEPGCCEVGAPVVADLDRDGDTDIASFHAEGSVAIHLTERSDPERRIRFDEHVIEHAGPGALDIEGVDPVPFIDAIAGISGDFDGDQVPDLAITLHGHGLVLHSDVRSGAPVRSRLISTAVTKVMASGHITGRTADDIVLLVDGRLEVLSIEGEDVTAIGVPWSAPLRGSFAQVLIGQLDADPNDEIVLVDRSDIAIISARLKADGTHDLDLRWSAQSPLTNAALANVAGVAGDRRLDLVGSHDTMIEIWQGARIGDADGFERYADFRLNGWPDGPLVLLRRIDSGYSDLVISRFNETTEEHELVALPGGAD